MKKLIVLIFLLTQIFTSAYAGQAKPLADDPALEGRLKSMSKELRCLVCQNSTLEDSDAPLAEDLRKEIRAAFLLQQVGNVFAVNDPKVRTRGLNF